MNPGIIISSFEHKNKAAIATNNNAVVDVDVCKKKNNYGLMNHPKKMQKD